MQMDAFVPEWEYPVIRFLNGSGELYIGKDRLRVMCTNLWGVLIHYDDDFSLLINGETISMGKMKHSAALFIGGAYEFMDHNLYIHGFFAGSSTWNSQSVCNRKRIFNMCYGNFDTLRRSGHHPCAAL